MEMNHVFISYKVEEFDQALAVRDYLGSRGIRCWMAPMSIRGGMSYAQEIPQAIRDSGAFVLILSEKAQESKWVPRELDQAINCGKVILPYVLEECTLRNDFSFYLTNVQRYDAYRDPKGTLERMADDICRMFGIVPPPAPAEEAPAEEPQVEAPKVKPAPKPKKEKKPAGKLKQFLMGALISVAILVALIVAAVLASLPQELTIAGQKFEEDDFSVRLENVTLTAADIEKFTQFQELSVIHLVNCTIVPRNLAPMVSQELMLLEMTNCNLTDAQFSSIDFSVMRFFTELRVGGNPLLTDISPAMVCAEKLEYLDISDTGVRCFEWLPQLKKLEVLRANNVGLSDLSVLESLVYLEQLSLSGNNIQSLEGLKNTSKLTKVDLSNNALTDVSVLSRSVNSLTELHLENNRIEDLAFLADAVNLKKVYVDGNCLTDLNWLLNNRSLQILSASRNSIGSIKGLGIGKNLRYLNLADNLLTEILSGDLVFGDDLYPVVNLQNNDLKTVELLPNCTYKQLVLLGNPQVNLEDLVGVKGWDVFFDFPVGVELSTLKALDFNNLCIVGCPLDRQVEIEEGLSGEELMTLEEAMEEILRRAEEADY